MATSEVTLVKENLLSSISAVGKSLCRFCAAPLTRTFVDLGMSPLCENYLKAEQLNSMEPFYPLHVFICESCLLVQLEEYVSPEEIFTEYAYFSSYATALLDHVRDYSGQMIDRFRLGSQSRVVEIASNDGYLLQYFAQRDVPVLGIEPAANVAAVAVEKGIPTVVTFFGETTANKISNAHGQADLLVGNNVLSQVPNLNDFLRGMKRLLKSDGVITMEFPHLLQLMNDNLFDTIYHEHFSYFSFITAEKIFAAHGLTIFDVEAVPIHGGSLRIFARHTEDLSKPVGPRVAERRGHEEAAGLTRLETYGAFTEKVKATKRELVAFLIETKRAGKSIAGYGAPGKSATLLNYCGIRTDFVDYTVDRNPYKHGRFTPGTHIPIYPPERIMETKPDYVLILPWNFKDEILQQMAHIRQWGGRFVVPLPELAVYD